MLDLKFIREQPEKIRTAVRLKNEKAELDAILSLDEKRRTVLFEVETLKHRQKEESRRIGLLKAQGKDLQKEYAELKELSLKIKQLDTEASMVSGSLQEKLLTIPNLPHESVPEGRDSSDNVLVREWGKKREFSFQPVPHWETGEALHLLNFKQASKISGTGFVVFEGKGALLQRAVLRFMLDLHIKKHNYNEVSPPFIVNRKAMTGTGQLPKLEDDMYHAEVDDLFLIPTAEVPVTNLYADEILNEEDLPIKRVSCTACFRREAGSYGKDTRGIIRLHQFDKVELVKIVKPEDSYQELELLLGEAETVLKKLQLPYRVCLLSSGDMSFAAAKCYDIEVWAPAQAKFLEVSSCSNFEAFQARRANIRYRRSNGKLDYVHTLNGSGLALPRLLVAIMETFQEEDGSLKIPDVLVPYMDGQESINPD
ncbi:MAG: serine--tRNA ligase [Candidatus Theseobacter exili]|nr:serine--tRNA ligase [Candidatus Theseobacter exili]